MSNKLKAIGIVSFLTVVSRFLGVIRDSLGGAIFGATGLYSAFLTAWALPNLFRRLLAEGSLTAAFIPTLQEELHHRKQEGAFALLSQVASWLLTITGTMVLLAMVVFRFSRLLPGHPERWYQAADLAALLFPYLVFIAITAACNATLNVMQRFTEPTLSPIWLNLAMIASLGGAGLHFAATKMGEIYWLVGGVLVGGFLQMSISAAVLIREGWRPRFDLQLSPRVKQIGWLMVPGLFATAIYQINILVSRLLAFSLDDSSSTLLFMGNRLMEFPIGVFAVAVSTVVYPLIAKHAVEGNREGMAEDYRKGLRMILIINVPAAAGLALLSRPIVDVIYRHGHFTVEQAAALAHLLMLFSIGLPFFSIVNLTVRAFYAVQDTKTPVKVGVFDFIINVILSIVLMRRFGTSGLVMASTTAIVVQTLLLQRSLVRRLPELTFRPLWISVAKVAAGTLAMAVVVWFGWRGLQHIGLRLRVAEIAALAVLIPGGIGMYALALWLLRIEGTAELELLLKRFKRKPAK